MPIGRLAEYVEQTDPKERILKHYMATNAQQAVDVEQTDPKERILKQLRLAWLDAMLAVEQTDPKERILKPAFRQFQLNTRVC